MEIAPALNQVLGAQGEGRQRQVAVAIPGPHGETVVAIRDGRACVVSASCPNKVCMGMGAAARQGELIACVPNALLLRVEGGADAGTRDYDLLSR